jgi:DNA repair protein RecO
VRNTVTALVINRIRYSNSSLIFKLFAQDIGLFSGILRGGLNNKGVAEVGDTVEASISRRGDEGLFLLSSFEIINHIDIAKSLIKTALRDSALEVIIASVQQEHRNNQIHELIGKYLTNLEPATENKAIFLFWLFLYRLKGVLGIGFSLVSCVKCSSQLTFGGELLPNSDGLLCNICSPKKKLTFTAEVLILLATGRPNPDDYIPTLSQAQRFAITTSLIENLLAHFESNHHIKSLHFLREII